MRGCRWVIVGALSGALMFLPWASAALRMSEHYALTVEGAGASGGAVASAHYEAHLVVGSTGTGLSQSDGEEVTGKFGFAGQLYEVVELGLSADPATVDEDATRPVEAVALMDDDSNLPLDPEEVAWSVEDGPIVSVSELGVARAGIVYEDTRAVVAGEYAGGQGSLDLTVLDIDFDNFEFYAGDGLPDDWQVLFFGLDDPNASPFVDFDFDGLFNLIEFGFGSDPTDALSGADLALVPELLPDEQIGVFLTVTFKRLPFPAHVTYVVEVSGDFVNWVGAIQIGAEGAPDENGFVEVTFRDTVAQDQATGPRLIRVYLLPQPES